MNASLTFNLFFSLLIIISGQTHQLLTLSLISVFSGSSRQFAGFSSEVDEPVVAQIWKRAAEFLPKLREFSLSDFSRSRKVRIGLRPYSESHGHKFS